MQLENEKSQRIRNMREEIELEQQKGPVLTPSTPSVRLRGYDTGIPYQICLLSTFLLLLTCVGYAVIEDTGNSFIPSGTMED